MTDLDFPARAEQALHDQDLQQALGKIQHGFVHKRAQARAAFPPFERLRDEARDIKAHVLDNLDAYLEAFADAVTRTGGHVHWARTAEEARNIVLDLSLRYRVRTLAKSKSMISEEIGLNATLEEHGIEVVETDLGEYIIQIRKEQPSHIIAPALHVTREQIVADFRRHHQHLDPQRQFARISDIVGEARESLRRTYFEADMGLTGANFLVAENGSVVIVTNEGNSDLTQMLGRRHVVLASIEKLVPTLEDASTILRVLARSATGQATTAYTTFACGPKRAEDLDGPEAFHIILLDNGRSQLLGGPMHEVLRCIRCGACMNHCPVYAAIGGHAYGSVYPGPIGSVLTPALWTGPEHRHLPNASTLCGRCESVCPVRIPLPRLLRKHRETEYQQAWMPARQRMALRLWRLLMTRPRLYHGVQAMARLGLRVWARGRPALSSVPLAHSWTQSRDLAKPPASSFRAWWNQR